MSGSHLAYGVRIRGCSNSLKLSLSQLINLRQNKILCNFVNFTDIKLKFGVTSQESFIKNTMRANRSHTRFLLKMVVCKI